MVAWDALADPHTAEAILDSIALGRIDYYVPMPASWPDEVFHHTISTFLLEWATELRKVPHTVHIIGEEWSGQGARAAGDVQELRGSAHVLPGRLRQGARAPREGSSRREAPGHDPSGRARARRPVER